MEARQVHCETFVLSSDALPSVDDMLRAADPEQLGQTYREAGLEMLASNVGPFRCATIAAQKYQELPAEDHKLYAHFLTQAIKLKDCSIPPPEDALTVLIAARKAKLFDSIVVLAHPTSGEYLLLGQIQVGTIVRYFKIAHWGYTLTGIEQLRKRHRRNSIIGHKLRSAFKVVSRFKFSQSSDRNYPSPVYFGAVTVLSALPCWLLLLPINWWLFAGALATVLTLCGHYVAKRSASDSAQQWTVAWLIVANVVAALVVGIIHINQWATADRTEEVLVCGMHEAEGAFDESWIIETSAGERLLESGFYNGTYYPTGNEVAARSLVGKWVKITEHGHGWVNSVGPYVTGAQVLRSGACG